MRMALSAQKVIFHRDDLLTRPEARAIVAEFMVKTGTLEQFQEVGRGALGMEEPKET